MYNKYKERNALDTINIIRDFFDSIEGITVEEEMENCASGFWWHKLRVKYNETEIVSTYGKGETREYSMASGYAELYERFAWYYNNMNEEDREVFPYETPIDAAALVKPFPQAVKANGQDAWHDALLNRFGKVAAVPFKNIWGEDTLLIDMNAKAEADGSNGIAAGNTLLEALNQGISELIERYVQNLCYKGEIRLEKVPEHIIAKVSPSIYEKVKALNERDVEVKIYDTSCSTGLPVLCSIIIDKTTMMHRFCFGAFPVFSIALERTLTEVFQGQITERHDFSPCMPYDSEDVSIDSVRNNRTSFPREAFISAKDLQEINSNIYLEEGVSNKEINDHLGRIMAAHGFSAYYYDMSLMDDMKAIYIHSPELQEHITFDSFCDRRSVNRVLGIINAAERGLNAADVYMFLNILGNLSINESRTLYYIFLRTSAGIYYIDYLLTVCNVLVQRYEEAYEYMYSIHPSLYSRFPNLIYLKTYLDYKMAEITTEEMVAELSFWEIPQDLIKAFIDNDFNKLADVYIREPLAGEKVKQVKEDMKRVRSIITEKRIDRFEKRD